MEPVKWAFLQISGRITSFHPRLKTSWWWWRSAVRQEWLLRSFPWSGLVFKMQFRFCYVPKSGLCSGSLCIILLFDGDIIEVASFAQLSDTNRKLNCYWSTDRLWILSIMSSDRWSQVDWIQFSILYGVQGLSIDQFVSGLNKWLQYNTYQ